MKLIVVLAALLVLFPLTSASYINGDIYVSENGVVSFNVESDVELNVNGLAYENEMIKGQTSMLTSKQGDVWTFALDFGKYDNMLLEVHFPKSLKAIQSIEGIDRILDTSEKTVTLVDSNKELDFSINYKLGDSNNYGWIYFIIFVLVFLGVGFYAFNIYKKKYRINTLMPVLNENEEKIIKALMENPMRQKALREKLGIPKASFTRYIINLEKKRLIMREGEGKNKILMVK